MSVFSKLSTCLASSPDGEGIIGNVVPLEVENRICQFMSLEDLLAYGNTSGIHRLQIQDFMRRVTNDEIRPFCRDPRALLDLLWRTSSIISGSVALAALITFELRNWQPEDMDIYTTTKQVKRILEHLKTKERFEVAVRVTKGNSEYDKLGSIKEVIKLVNERGRRLDVIVSSQKCAFTATLRFYGSQVVNGITGRGLICAYPQLLFAYRAMLNAGATNPIHASVPLSVQRCMVKYTMRGFTFDTNPVAFWKAPHTCAISKSCPHTIRHLFDRGTMVIAFHDAQREEAFIDNKMSKVFRGRYQNVWCFGGDACDIFIDEPVRTAAFLMELRRIPV